MNANRFVKLGEAGATTSTGTKQYSFTDAEDGKAGVRYYRLKTVNANGTFSYSDVRAVMFGGATVWQVYPNPSTGRFNLLYQAPEGQEMTAKLYDSKGSVVKEYRSRATGFLQKLSVDVSANNYASGVYLLRAEADTERQTFKLYKQ